ncbi:uncharacterized protein PAC_09303 [Phialocephala subalpina]|uniref:L-asparaginase n=1 Tax=Phialocephala subalpina TaxID=576137 RepID=A0A1L7X315_9HELO|nr:uncharacterized protein PAC_09303 [Phialocephala subalpina]
MGDETTMSERLSKPRYSVALHAGAAESWFGDAEVYKKPQSFLGGLIRIAERQLLGGGIAIDVVTNIVARLENYPQFNAGKGSAVNIDGFHVLEAAIIDGRNCEYRAVAALVRTKNPIRLAHAMLSEESPAFLVGTAADDLASKKNLDMVENSYFSTPTRMNYWNSNMNGVKSASEYHGTVGAVALDTHGNLAAANSTGGLNFKIIGRIGDTAIVGAGIYADDVVAIVCGSGEAILKATVAGRAAAEVRNGKNIAKAIEDALLKSADLFPTSSCGVIGIDSEGEISMHCNSRIFAVASASSSSSEKAAGIIPSTIPTMNALICYEDNLLKAALSKYPTMANQIIIESRGAPLVTMELDLFLEYFETIWKIAQALKRFGGADFCAFVTRGGGHSTIGPVSVPRKEGSSDSRRTSLSTQDSFVLEKRILTGGYQALFYCKPDAHEPFVGVGIVAHNSNTSGFFSIEANTHSAASAIWETLQLLIEFGQDTNMLTIEIGPTSESGTLATISVSGSAPTFFPGPAPFHEVYPRYITTELGRRAVNLPDLPDLAARMSRQIFESFEELDN